MIGYPPLRVLYVLILSDLSPVPTCSLRSAARSFSSLVRSKSKTLARNIFIPLALFLC